MRNNTLLLFIAFMIGNISFLTAQSEDDNVIITNSIETYSFEEEKGNAVVKEKTETYYECTKRGTSITIMESYDNQTSLDKVSGKKKSNPEYRLYTSDNMFYSDLKVCYFDLYFDRKGTTGEVKFEKTHKDPRYFTTIYFPEYQFIKEKTVSVSIPDWMKAEIVEHNLGKNIKKEVKIDDKSKKRIYIYTITDEPAMKTEKNMRGRSFIYPHIQVVSKYSMLNGIKTTYFETLDDQYAWYHNIVKEVNNDKTIIKAKADEITKNCKTDEEKIRSLFAWVQDNIRYLAFLDGIAGFKPDDAQEVLRKKYGDCKGMSNLLKSLLEAQGFDARLAWLGTKHIAYNYTIPSLSTDNHMICALFFDGKTYYLDPTVKYMPMGEYPQTIQGRQTLVEDKDRSKYLLNTIPEFAAEMNTDSLFCEYRVENDVMQGKARQYYMGESKQVIMSLMDATPKDKLSQTLKVFLENDNSKDAASDVEIKGASSQSEEVEMAYQIINKSGIQALGSEYYIDLERKKDFMNNNIDTEKRINDLEFMYRHHIVANVVLHIPSGYKVTHLPPPLNIEKEDYIFQTEYKQEGDKITYKKRITILSTYLPKARFAEWNKDISLLKKSYMEQIILTK